MHKYAERLRDLGIYPGETILSANSLNGGCLCMLQATCFEMLKEPTGEVRVISNRPSDNFAARDRVMGYSTEDATALVPVALLRDSSPRDSRAFQITIHEIAWYIGYMFEKYFENSS